MRRLVFAAAAAVILSARASESPQQLQSAARPAPQFASDRISITSRGSGPDIILVHGMAAHPDVWNDSAETLDDRYRLHLVHINGFGGALPRANADGPVSAPVAEEIARYIREARLEKPAIIGQEMGGTIAMMVAARHPELPGRVLVFDTVPSAGPLLDPQGTADVRALADFMKAEILKDESLEYMARTVTNTEAAKPLLMKYARESHRQTVANAFHELLVTDLGPELRRITVPLTVLYEIGPELRMPDQFENLLRQMYSSAPRSHLVRIHDSNRYIQIDQPVRFLAEVDAFMKR